MTMWNASVLAWLIVLGVAGGVLLCLLARFRPGRGPEPERAERVLRVSGWTMLLSGFFAGLGVLTNLFAIFAIPAAAAVLAAAVRRYRNMERQALLRVLMASAERGIPLETAARAFAGERRDTVGSSARKLAEYLEAGMPLSFSLKRSRLVLPDAALLAAELGPLMGVLGPSLRRVVDHMEEFEETLRSIFEKFLYFVCLALFAGGLLSFMMLKIVPVFRQMFEEFDLELPQASIWLIGISWFAVRSWFLLLPLLAVLLFLLWAGLLSYTGFSWRGLPWMSRLTRSVDAALIMRWLAIAVRCDRPIAEAVELLAGCYPQRRARVLLERASQQIGGGAGWCEGLEQSGLIKRSEAAVFQAAERAGNLSWALEEMADSGMRRAAYRLRACVSVAFPALVLAFGGGVLFIALGMLMPLMNLIGGLA